MSLVTLLKIALSRSVLATTVGSAFLFPSFSNEVSETNSVLKQAGLKVRGAISGDPDLLPGARLIKPLD